MYFDVDFVFFWGFFVLFFKGSPVSPSVCVWFREMPLVRLRKVISVPGLLRVFIINGCCLNEFVSLFFFN